jgi:hypothetical protein
MQGLPNITDGEYSEGSYVRKLLGHCRHVAGWDLLAIGVWCVLNDEVGPGLLCEAALTCDDENLVAVAACVDAALKFRVDTSPCLGAAKLLVGRGVHTHRAFVSGLVLHWTARGLWPPTDPWDGSRCLVPSRFVRGYVLHKSTGEDGRPIPATRTGDLYRLKLETMCVAIDRIMCRVGEVSGSSGPSGPCVVCGDPFDTDSFDGFHLDCVCLFDGSRCHLYCAGSKY